VAVGLLVSAEHMDSGHWSVDVFVNGGWFHDMAWHVAYWVVLVVAPSEKGVVRKGGQ
jgi:hypothetical protein